MTFEGSASPPPPDKALPTLADLEVGLERSRRALLLETPDELERRLARGYRNGWFALAALAGGCLALTVLALLHPSPALVLLIPFGGLVLINWLRWLYRIRRGEHRLQTAPAVLLGKYSREEVAGLVRAASGRFPPGEQPVVFVRESRLGNADSNNSWLFDFWPRHNAIGLNSYLLHALDAEELRAVVLHELAHFHHHITPAGRNMGFVLLSWIPLLAGLFSAVGSPIWPLHLLLCALVHFGRSRALKRSAALSQVLELALSAPSHESVITDNRVMAESKAVRALIVGSSRGLDSARAVVSP
jgi:Zn-dependent protease with chaperone function